MHKDLRQVLQAAKKQGLKVESTPGGHVKVYRAEEPTKVVIVAATTSKPRSIKNYIALLRRDLGFEWKGR